ncbi:MAG TPA: GNAT family N-acetyltransferase [Acidimicrobiaceae bacterium]|nr:GNAT family N-acetyltransferase [Acidimicrobiaceae bacterium]
MVAEDTGAVRAVPVELVRPLRARILRPGLPLDQSVYPGDDHPEAAHVAVLVPGASGADADAGDLFDDEVVVAVGSVFEEGPPAVLVASAEVGPAARGGRWWRIRGMATAEGWRSRGLGGTVLGALLERAAARGAGVVWCNARVPAIAFYRRAGFREVGDVFEAPGIGPHIVMWRAVADRR